MDSLGSADVHVQPFHKPKKDASQQLGSEGDIKTNLHNMMLLWAAKVSYSGAQPAYVHVIHRYPPPSPSVCLCDRHHRQHSTDDNRDHMRLAAIISLATALLASAQDAPAVRRQHDDDHHIYLLARHKASLDLKVASSEDL